MQFNCKMGYSGNEQDYQLIKTSISELKKYSNQKEILRYLTNVLPNPTDIVTLDNAQNTVKSVKAQLANKNLIPYPYTDTTKTLNGITFTVNSDGSVTVNGTATAQAYFKLQQSFSLKKGQYFLNGCPTGGAGTKYSLYLSTSDYKFYKADIGNGISINSEDDKIVSIVINITKDTTVDNLVFKPQLELGTTATAYTPYISDFSTVKVNTYGKNLFDISSSRGFESMYTGLTNTINGNELTVTATADRSGNLLLGTFPKGTYTINLNFSKKVDLFIQYGESISNLTRLDGRVFNSSHTFSISETRKLWIACPSFIKGNIYIFTDIQFELGTTATAYEPYQGQTYTPTATGEVTGITVLTPTTNIINDKGLLFTKVTGDDFNYIN